MQYPLISEYIESIRSAEDNFASLTNLRPILDESGTPVMSSGNFAVVFKMTDGKKNYAIKCFTKEQEGREEAYKLICQHLHNVSSPYMVHTEYMEKELFVDTNQSDEKEFPVLVMDWVEGMSLDCYMKVIQRDQEKRIRLANEFRELTFWLMWQEFAHGDLKPDNIIVTDSGHLVLVDYDGMFVPSMRGQNARELGTPLYRFKGRRLTDFDEFTDDYACVFIMLMLIVNSIEPVDFNDFTSPDVKNILHYFSSYLENAQVSPYLAAFLLVASCGRLERQMLYPLLSYRSDSTWYLPMQPTNVLNDEYLSLIEKWHFYKSNNKWKVKAIFINKGGTNNPSQDDSFTNELEVEEQSLKLIGLYGLSQCDAFFINKHAITMSEMKMVRIIPEAFPFEICDIKWDEFYARKWRTGYIRSIDLEEQNAVVRAEIVESQYGNSVCFHLVSGGKIYIPLSENSSLRVGECINLSKAKLITLCRNGDKDIYRMLER